MQENPETSHSKGELRIWSVPKNNQDCPFEGWYLAAGNLKRYNEIESQHDPYNSISVFVLI
jgi:hypothetical protein